MVKKGVAKLQRFFIFRKLSNMSKAYLQNKKAQYYILTKTGSVGLSDERTALQTTPEMMSPSPQPVAAVNYKSFEQTGFIFRNDGCRILSYLFFINGMDADCILTLEDNNIICGNLDFSTARIYGRKEIR